jgi:prepilin-type N-terminal cleavage/methylation domain-containing protein
MTNLTYSRKAFTLIELIIVIAIIIIMVGVTAPMASSYIVERSLYNAAARVQQDIRLVQELAIVHSSNSPAHFRIHFYPEQNEYKIEADYDANYVLGSGKIIKRKFSDAYGFPKHFGKDTPDSVTFGTLSAPGNTATVDLNFNNRGIPKKGAGHINLMNRSGSKQIKVIVSVIGRVRIEWVKR